MNNTELFDALFDSLFSEDGKPKEKKSYPNNYEIFKEFEKKRNIACKTNRHMGDILGFVGLRNLSPFVYKELMKRGIVKRVGVCYVLAPEYEKDLGVTYNLYRGGNKNHRAINWYWRGFDMILNIIRTSNSSTLNINENMTFS